MGQRTPPRSGYGIRLALGATLAGGLVAGDAAAGDPFAVRELPRGYMLAADTFVPTVPENKEDAEGALCAGEMGSDRDKHIEEGRCAYTDPEDDGAPPEERRDGDDSARVRG
ncbi:MAG TPA: hypothetical protein VKA55_07420 [Gammaproteobacteria bacterium]|nr:hypothetical protein [Gammaproteobacteria bacterium]